ncbi:hypothetical protein [Streptomyces beigongshangae]|uniref:hypothetical protein n=1 Tax=Streptomyces beigongshangae TaxID=2841597 RepID=UPI001C85DEC8|nr:hypothetical protein [Streptomyces sp. REN17]
MSQASQVGINTMMRDMGLSATCLDGTVRPKALKALLAMDAYVFLSGGPEQIRFMQQLLNGRYLERSTFCTGPCDGFFSRGPGTWAHLLVSYGNPDREGVTACDPRFTVTPRRAEALYKAKYYAVGRYLDEPAGSTLNKEIQSGGRGVAETYPPAGGAPGEVLCRAESREEVNFTCS